MDAQKPEKFPAPSAEPEDNGPPPPPYPSASASNIALPAYQLTSSATTVVPYCPFPSVMTGYGTWSMLQGMTTLIICGATSADRLYLVHMHFDGTSKPPLGQRNGCILHNGLTVRDPVVAATGENLAGELRFRWEYLNTSSVVMVSDAAGPKGFVTEVMSGLTTPQGEVVFRFGMEVGTAEKLRREDFEWVKFGKGGDEDDKEAKGHKLFRCVARQDVQGEDAAASSLGARETSLRETEALAVLTWPRGLLTFMVSHQFTLKLTEASQTEGMSERWKVMVLMTALRLGGLRAQGATNKTVVRHSTDKDGEEGGSAHRV